MPHEVPRLPYLKEGAYILEEAGNAFPILIDCYSHWIDIRPLATKSFAFVINAMQDIFNIHGFLRTALQTT
ncbi:hypothetical protein PR048_012230 [Dryococelus australis]|uniref:Uncharacterized protein n=1 Tax=Dryococelus australis TaxID=614101 RepID=A0ABQ9HNU6_9NEOP|nr:hypothetical protein PR048_012230 [Dryococelus australis]